MPIPFSTTFGTLPINCSPDNPSYHYILGFTYSIQSEWSKAIGEFEVALDKEPNNSEHLRGLGWALHSAGDKAKGLAYLHRAVDLAPTDVNILTDLATAYLSDLQFHKAREYAETAMRIDPNSNVTREVLSNIDRFQRNLRRFG